MSKITKNFTILSVILLLLIVIPRILIVQQYKGKILDTNADIHEEVGIVFGASVYSDFTPSLILKDRLDTAIILYDKHKISKILVSGDNHIEKYNEPTTMATYLEAHGIPKKDIIIDYAGLRTYDTCKRAHDIFQINSAVLITQRFHLPRALFLCNHLGVKSIGVSATQNKLRVKTINYVREFLATDYALVNIYIYEPSIIGGPIEHWRK